MFLELPKEPRTRSHQTPDLPCTNVPKPKEISLTDAIANRSLCYKKLLVYQGKRRTYLVAIPPNEAACENLHVLSLRKRETCITMRQHPITLDGIN
jgi:hypothetical protein